MYPAKHLLSTAPVVVSKCCAQIFSLSQVAPLTLFPTVAPQEALNDIVRLQSDINLLMHRVAHDENLLNTALGGAMSVDPFLQNLFDIYRHVDRQSQWELGLIRSDYILTSQQSSASKLLLRYKQVEINTICMYGSQDRKAIYIYDDNASREAAVDLSTHLSVFLSFCLS